MNCYKFADDGTIVAFHDDPNKCHELMQDICNHLEKWCIDNMLVLNCDKTKTEAILLKTGESQGQDMQFPKLRIEEKKSSMLVQLKFWE